MNGKHCGLKVEAERNHVGLCAISGLGQVKFTVSKTITLPEDDLRVELAVRKDSLLEASDEASVGHEAHRELKSGYW